jgi:hypothetical protein
LINVERAPMGFTTLIAVVTFLGGVQLIGIGVLGEYLARVYDEVKNRPLYLIKRPATRRDGLPPANASRANTVPGQ